MSRDGVVRSSKRIIRVTPTLSTDAYAQGDVLFTATEIPRAVLEKGGCSKLVGAYIFDKSDSSDDVIFVFTEGNTALGTNNICGISRLDGDIATSGAHIDTSKIHQMVPMTGVGENNDDLMLLQAASDSTSVYVQGLLVSSTTPTFADGDLQLILHIED